MTITGASFSNETRTYNKNTRAPPPLDMYMRVHENRRSTRAQNETPKQPKINHQCHDRRKTTTLVEQDSNHPVKTRKKTNLTNVVADECSIILEANKYPRLMCHVRLNYCSNGVFSDLELNGASRSYKTGTHGLGKHLR